jgi:hypothetical protein
MKSSMNEQRSGRPTGKTKIALAFLMAGLFFLGSVLADFADARTRRHDRHGRPAQKTVAKKRTGKPQKQKKPRARKIKRGRKNPVRKNADDKVVFMRGDSRPFVEKG